jgi:tetratricopeptide (TPR) repeat protein
MLSNIEKCILIVNIIWEIWYAYVSISGLEDLMFGRSNFNHFNSQYLDMGDAESALNCWKKATALKRTHSQAWINMVILLEQQEKLLEAKVVALTALSVLEDCDTLHFIVGNILGKLSEYETAESHFNEAIRIRFKKENPIPAKYYSNLG